MKSVAANIIRRRDQFVKAICAIDRTEPSGTIHPRGQTHSHGGWAHL